MVYTRISRHTAEAAPLRSARKWGTEMGKTIEW